MTKPRVAKARTRPWRQRKLAEDRLLHDVLGREIDNKQRAVVWAGAARPARGPTAVGDEPPTRPGAPEAPPEMARWLRWGAGPRAGQCLLMAAKAHAVLEGRFAVSCADVRAYGGVGR